MRFLLLVMGLEIWKYPVLRAGFSRWNISSGRAKTGNLFAVSSCGVCVPGKFSKISKNYVLSKITKVNLKSFYVFDIMRL